MSVSPLPSINEDRESNCTTVCVHHDDIHTPGKQHVLSNYPETRTLKDVKDGIGLIKNSVVRLDTHNSSALNDRIGLRENVVVIPETKGLTTVKELIGLEEHVVGKPDTHSSEAVRDSIGLKENVEKPDTHSSEAVRGSIGLKENVQKLDTHNSKVVRGSVGLKENVEKPDTHNSVGLEENDAKPAVLNDRIRAEKDIVLSKSEKSVENTNNLFNKHSVLNRRSSDTDNNVLKSNHISASKQMAKHRPASWIQKFSQKEHESLLPRRSHFSCHDKALKEAGYTSDEYERKKAERTERRKILEAKLLEAQSDINNSRCKAPTNGKMSIPEILVFEPEELDDVVKAKAVRGRKKYDDSLKVEHKALTEYLKYVKENTTEYLEYLKSKQKSPENLPDNHLIKTAMLFQKGHHGLPYDTPTVRAAHTLNTRFADPGQWQQLNRDHANTLRRLVRKDSIISKLIAEKEKEIKVDSDEPKTEYEKLLFRAEKWLKTVSTAQLMRARQQALKEVDEEDIDVTQWWIAMQNCSYLRRVNTSSTSNEAG